MITATTVEGLDQLRATLAGAADQLRDLSGPAAEAGQALQQAGEAHAPVLTGELAGSFGLLVEGGVATVTVGAGHGVPVQFGTQYMAAQPFIPEDPADVAVPIYAEYLEQVLDSIHGI